MLHRFATALLAVTLISGGVLSCPCIAKACAMAGAMQMDCCDDGEPGIGAPDCCTGGTQLSRQEAAPGVFAPGVGVILADARLAAPAAPAAPPALPRFVGDVAAGPAPPGGTLIAQHTSLLL